MDTLGRCIAIIVAVVLLFLFPLRYDALLTERSIESYVENESEHFLNNLLVEQEVSQEALIMFQERLSATGRLYSVNLTGRQAVNYLNAEHQQETHTEYEDLTERLKTEDKILLTDGYYLTLTVTKTTEEFTDRLKNLFFPTFLTGYRYVTGGVVNEYL